MALLGSGQGLAGGNATPQQNCVLMFYGMNERKMNCERLFNLLCLYGNVIRVKFLKSKDGAAMVQVGVRRGVSESQNNILYN
jgi:heterogeneous nuclear ribonucleoprotein L